MPVGGGKRKTAAGTTGCLMTDFCEGTAGMRIVELGVRGASNWESAAVTADGIAGVVATGGEKSVFSATEPTRDGGEVTAMSWNLISDCVGCALSEG